MFFKRKIKDSSITEKESAMEYKEQNEENTSKSEENSGNTADSTELCNDEQDKENIEVSEIFSNDISKMVVGNSDWAEEAETREDFIDTAVEKTIEYFTVTSPSILNSYDKGIIDTNKVKEYVYTYIKKDIRSEKFGKCSKVEADQIYESFAKYIWGYDILEPLIDDIDISDINITRYDRVNIKINGERKLHPIKFRGEDSYKRFVEHVAIKNRKSISDINAIQWFVDSTSSDKFKLRIDISADILSSDKKTDYLSIRKIPKFKYGFAKLIEKGMLTERQAEYLSKRVADGHSGVIGGKGGSGKTILLNELIEELPMNGRYDVIQDNDELFCDTHPDIMFHTTLEPQGEARISYGLDILGRNGLLEDLDGFIIGEIKGKEAAYLGHMAYTDHQVWCTTHAEGVFDMHYKIADYAKEITKETPEQFMRKIKSIDTIVYMHNFKIIDIAECYGIDENGKLIIEKIEV